MKFDILIVGAGHCGAQAAVMLCHNKFEGYIAIVGDEPKAPYERLPLGKEYFSGKIGFERILIRPQSFWNDREESMPTGTRVVSVDPADKKITTDVGEAIEYDKLILATGGRPRTLPIPDFDMAGIHGVCTRVDADAIRAEVDAANDVVVIGGDFIGLDATAFLSKFKKNLVILGALKRVLARVAGETLSRVYKAEHRACGVVVRLSQNIAEAINENDKVTGGKLTDGTVIPAQMVVVGIGINPSVQALITPGAKCTNAVDATEYCRTSLTDIYAIGDSTAHTNDFSDDTTIRLDTVQNAKDQATTLAQAICGNFQSYHATPWF